MRHPESLGYDYQFRLFFSDKIYPSTAGGMRMNFIYGLTKNVPGLAAQFQIYQELLVFGQIVSLDIVEQLSAATGQCNQSSTRMEILAVNPQVVGEQVDACAE